MESPELIELMKQIEEKGIGWDKVQEKAKISHALLNLYAKSGPVPVTVMKNLEKVLNEGTA